MPSCPNGRSLRIAVRVAKATATSRWKTLARTSHALPLNPKVVCVRAGLRCTTVKVPYRYVSLALLRKHLTIQNRFQPNSGLKQVPHSPTRKRRMMLETSVRLTIFSNSDKIEKLVGRTRSLSMQTFAMITPLQMMLLKVKIGSARRRSTWALHYLQKISNSQSSINHRVQRAVEVCTTLTCRCRLTWLQRGVGAPAQLWSPQNFNLRACAGGSLPHAMYHQQWNAHPYVRVRSRSRPRSPTWSLKQRETRLINSMQCTRLHWRRCPSTTHWTSPTSASPLGQSRKHRRITQSRLFKTWTIL